MFFLPSIAQGALAAFLVIIITSIIQMTRQEIRRIREFRLYLDQLSHGQLTANLLYRPADHKSQELMLGVLRKKETHACQ